MPFIPSWEMLRELSESLGILHSTITAALDATNGNARKVQKLSRHRNLNTLMIYDDNRQQHQTEVTGILADLV